MGNLTGGALVFVLTLWIRAYPDACVRCLQAIDKAKRAAVKSMRQCANNADDVPAMKDAYDALTAVQDCLGDTFGHVDPPDHTRITAALDRFEAAVDHADTLSPGSRSTAASLDGDLVELADARKALRRAVLSIAERHWLFKLYGRLQSIGS